MPSSPTHLKPDKTDEQPFRLFAQPSRPAHKYNVAKKEDRTDQATGIVFDSKMELKLWNYLRKHIPHAHIHRQVAFELLPAFTIGAENVRPIHLVVDFVIGPQPLTADSIVLDAKGMSTPDFLLKRKMFLYRYRMPILLANGTLSKREPRPSDKPKKRAKRGARIRVSANEIIALYHQRFPQTKPQ